jgi:hypothetical protein
MIYQYHQQHPHYRTVKKSKINVFSYLKYVIFVIETIFLNNIISIIFF